jgi:penicillin-binding protein 1A
MNLVEATVRSDNSVYQQLDLDVGPDLVADTATDLGIETPLDGFPAEGLGGLGRGVTPLEMGRAYATFATGGERLDPSAIASVELPGGENRDFTGLVSDKAYKDGETWQVTRILQRNMKEGTGTAAQIGCPAAGKTGTTDDFRDAWFAGYTPRLSTVVWVGYPHRFVPMTDVHGIKVAGGTFPAQIWHDYMSVAKGRFCGQFPKPTEKPELKPFCGRLAVTKKCNAPSLDGAGSNGGATGPEAVDQTTPGEAAPAAPVPDTTITRSPPPQTTSRSAVFRFKALEEAAKGFECSIDSGPFSRCSSPAQFSGLRPGDHVFSVRALSSAGDPDATPATRTWNVFEDLVPRKPQEKQKPPPKQPQPKEEPPELIG